MCKWVCTWPRVQGVCVSEQEFSCLQGTREKATQVLLMEQLLPPLPNPALLAVKIWGGGERWLGRCWLQKQYNTIRPIWGWESLEWVGRAPQWHPVLKYCCRTPQCHEGEIQRETSSKTVGGSGRLWPALTEILFVISGVGEHIENRSPRARYHSVEATQKLLKEELRRLKSLQGTVLVCMCAHVQWLWKQRTWENSGIESCWTDCGTQPSLYRGESLSPSLLWESGRLGTRWPGVEHLRFVAARQVPTQSGEPSL